MNQLEDFIRASIKYGLIAVVLFAGVYEGYKYSTKRFFHAQAPARVQMAKVNDAGYRDLRPEVLAAGPNADKQQEDSSK